MTNHSYAVMSASLTFDVDQQRDLFRMQRRKILLVAIHKRVANPTQLCFDLPLPTEAGGLRNEYQDHRDTVQPG